MMFRPLDQCWVCQSRELKRFHQFRLDYRKYEKQDPELAAYTGHVVWLVHCVECGFGQPEQLPTLVGFFDRMYDQRWSSEWIEREFDGDYKDLIFRGILRELWNRRVADDDDRPRLLDVGAHAGRFLHLAQGSGWSVEGIELNPRTAAYAARRTGAPVHRTNAQKLADDGRRFAAVTLTDVLEHIPDPVSLLVTVARLLQPRGTLAVKVPCGPSQWHKERVLRAVLPTHRVSLADNLVHVNHFSPRSLSLALERAGFARIAIRTAAPELVPVNGSRFRASLSNAVRLGVYVAGSLPGAVHTPLALNLQAFAQRPAAIARDGASH
jgi:SAM-dependent methyltransferase